MRYWIPTQDEWIKAARYDLNKVNLDGTTGGWWKYSIISDTQPAYGPPGVNVNAIGFAGPNPEGPRAQANAAWN